MEWWVAAKHDIHDDAQAPHISTLIILASEDLWCYVIWSAGLRCQHLALLELLCKSKVDELQIALLDGILRCQDEIFRLQISMGDALEMKVVHGAKHRLHHQGALRLTEVARLDDAVEELAPNAQLHHQVDIPVVFEGLIELANVGMVQELHDVYLHLQLVLFTLHLRFADAFDGTNSVCLFVSALAHRAIGALTNLLLFYLVEVLDFTFVVLDKL
mmetsp:Transcript_87143/g.154262  ORF Transcript_87143/g.154262 Transcript_87143/m.154262 type:complete len:216 (+) Transcript_87143:858-1505(+)